MDTVKRLLAGAGRVQYRYAATGASAQRKAGDYCDGTKLILITVRYAAVILITGEQEHNLAVQLLSVIALLLLDPVLHHGH